MAWYDFLKSTEGQSADLDLVAKRLGLNKLIGQSNAQSSLLGGPEYGQDGNPLLGGNGQPQSFPSPQAPQTLVNNTQAMGSPVQPGTQYASRVSVPGLLGHDMPETQDQFNQGKSDLLGRAYPDVFGSSMAQTAAMDQRLKGMDIDQVGKTLLAVDPTGKLYGDYTAKTNEPTPEQKVAKALAQMPADDPRRPKLEAWLDKQGYVKEKDPLYRDEAQATITKNNAEAGLAGARQKVLDNTGLDEDTLERIYQGGKVGQKMSDIAPNIGRGTQGPAQLTQILNYSTKRMKEEGLSQAQIASAQVNLKAQTAAASMAAKRGTGIDIGADELTTFGDQALEAADRYGNGNFVPWNQLSNMAAAAISDPKLAALKTALQGVKGAYATILTRGGANNVDAQKKSDDLLNSATGIPALKAIVAQMKREAIGAKAATVNVQNDIGARISAGSPAGTTASPVKIPETVQWGRDANGRPVRLK